MLPQFKIKAYHGTDPFCFVSYAHDDSEIVFAELDFLSSRGFRIYYDEGIHPGHIWHEDVAQAIENCSLCIMLVTRRSIESRNCQRELNFALDKDIPVLAIHLEQVTLPSGMQLALGDRQAILKSRFTEADFRDNIDSAIADFVTRDPSNQQIQEPLSVSNREISRHRNRWVLGITVLILLCLGYAAWHWVESDRLRLVDRENTEKQIETFIAKDRYLEAYMLARKLGGYSTQLRSAYAEKIIVPGTPRLSQNNVSVSFKPYHLVDSDWIPLGITPFPEPLPIPRGVLSLKLELDGYETRYIMARNPGPMFDNLVYLDVLRDQFPIEEVTLFAIGKIPLDMVEVPASKLPLFVPGWSRLLNGLDILVPTPQFAVSRFEVTNAEYKEFVDKGAYQNPAYWDGLQFFDGDLQLSREEAISRFVDKTGRPGPSHWALSNFEQGESKLPVGGVSWYEAVAYARFRRLALPTIYHWTRYALGPLEGLYPVASALNQASNFNAGGLLPAESPLGMGPWGTYHTSGNVREWIWNSAEGMGIAQGDSWRGYGGTTTMVTVPRMNRQADNGIRLIQHLEPELHEELMEPIDLVYDDPYALREPASDEAFEIMRAQFTAPKRQSPDVDIVRVQETDHWVVDEHTLKFTEDETLVLYIYTPTTGKEPYQTVVYGPDGSAVNPGQDNRDAVDEVAHFQDVLRGGRAVILPIWAGTYERADEELF